MQRHLIRIFIPVLLILSVLAISLISFHALHADTPGTTSIVAIHGINSGNGPMNTAVNGDNTMPHCATYWEDARAFLKDRWGGDLRQIGFYQHDCPDNGSESTLSADLHDARYTLHCTTFASGNDGTNNENLDHLSCLLAWYLYYNFGQEQHEEILVGHSMGGLIIRRALELFQEHDRRMPPSVGYVKQVFSFSTPETGKLLAGFMCEECLQGRQMTWGGGFINDLYYHGQSPQAGGTTEWILIGSSCDGLVGIGALRMHASKYYWYNGALCYDHGNIIHDGRKAHIMTLSACSTTTPSSNACAIDLFGTLTGPAWRNQTAAPHTLDLLYEIISGIIP